MLLWGRSWLPDGLRALGFQDHSVRWLWAWGGGAPQAPESRCPGSQEDTAWRRGRGGARPEEATHFGKTERPIVSFLSLELHLKH